MRIVAFIMDPEQIDRIMKHLIKQGRAPPGENSNNTKYD